MAHQSVSIFPVLNTKIRNIGLDTLRAAAIVGVVLAHGLNVNIAGRDIVGPLGSGVELFFVLSGFLIGRIYFRSSVHEDFSLWQFWRSRWWRTLPPYFAGILVYLVVGSFIGSPSLPWYYYFFLQNNMGVTGFGVSWSLCVEEHFYLLLPIVAWVVDRVFGRDSMKFLLPAVFLIPTLLRILLTITAKPLPLQWFWYTPFHCDGLIVGVYLAYLFVDNRIEFVELSRLAKWFVPLVPITMVTYTFWAPRPLIADMFVCTCYAIGYGAGLLWLYPIDWEPKTASGRLLRAGIQGIALCSYSVYLTHATFDPMIRGHILASMHRGPIKSLIVLSSTFLLGVAFYFLVEKPTIISRDYFLHRGKIATLESRSVVELS